MVLWFGKYKGYSLFNVPTGYLTWLLSVKDASRASVRERELRKAIIEELAKRGEPEHAGSERRHAYSEAPNHEPFAAPGMQEGAVALAIVAAGRRALAAKHHPDLPGGNLRQMQTINGVAGRLEGLARQSFLMAKS